MALNAVKADLSRIHGGVYRLCNSLAEEQIIGGRLSYVSRIAQDRGATLEYLCRDKDGRLAWETVSVDEHKHYHRDQYLQLLRWFYDLSLPLSKPGFYAFGQITGLRPSRIADALRRADSPDYKPFSGPAMLYIEYALNLSKEK